ncbi:MAG: HEAT repeat domain-containing protein [Phycisphaerales bacterium]|nr:MAG: HEAT repeat domain-containing protein [Phycisphaerales bacterium]
MAGLACSVLLAGCATIGQDLNALGRSLVPPTPREAAQKMLNPHDPDDRREGTVLLSNSTFGGVEVYVRAYRDGVTYENDPLAKAAFVRALARHGTVDDAPLIASQLTHEHYQVRWEAAKGLQRLHNPAVVGDLLRVLGDDVEDADIRLEVAVALGQYAEDRVFQGLISALDARELAVNLAAEQSLRTLTGQSLGPDPRMWLAWYDAAEEPFAGEQDYLYPTYSRRQSWLEKLAFWSSPVVEYPAPPAGLRPSTERRTYEEEQGEESGG